MFTYQVKTFWPEYKVRWFLNEIPGIFAGEYGNIREAALAGALHSLLGNIEKDFRRKSAGGSGEDGDIWQPLSQRRIKERLKKTRNKYIDKLGKKLFKLREARGNIGLGEGSNLPILIDEGNLVTSISQGVMSGVGSSASYSKPDGQEVSLTDVNAIEMDTHVSGAHEHQFGHDDHPPQRIIVPQISQDSWSEEMSGVVSQIICEFIQETLQGPEPR